MATYLLCLAVIGTAPLAAQLPPPPALEGEEAEEASPPPPQQAPPEQLEPPPPVDELPKADDGDVTSTWSAFLFNTIWGTGIGTTIGFLGFFAASVAAGLAAAGTGAAAAALNPAFTLLLHGLVLSVVFLAAMLAWGLFVFPILGGYSWFWHQSDEEPEPWGALLAPVPVPLAIGVCALLGFSGGALLFFIDGGITRLPLLLAGTAGPARGPLGGIGDTAPVLGLMGGAMVGVVAGAGMGSAIAWISVNGVPDEL